MSNFSKTLFCAGFGGQGVMVLGQLVAYGGIEEGRYVSWLPSYGPEMRGGTANCAVTVSDSEIGSPFISTSDVVIALNQPSLEKYEQTVKSDGILLYNEDLCQYKPTRSDIKVYPIKATQIAESVKNPRSVNVVLLGALIALSDYISNDTAKSTIAAKLGARKPEFLESNLAAYELGRKAAIELKKNQ